MGHIIKNLVFTGINTGKDNFFCTFTNIQGVAVTDFIALTIDSNRTGTANIDNT